MGWGCCAADNWHDPDCDGTQCDGVPDFWERADAARAELKERQCDV